MWLTELVALCLLGLASAAEDKKLSSHAAALADTSTDLAFSLYHTMAKEKEVENILLSPVVVASSLAVLALGGKASTAAQAKTLLNAGKLSDQHLHAGLTQLLSEVSDAKTRNTTWKINSRLYGPSSVSFADDFVKTSKKHYNYEHSKINFRDKRSAINAINEWASKSTDGKLSEVTKDVHNTDGAMIINAMFFKPHWEEKFHEKMVDNRVFLVTRSLTVSVPMMHRTGLYDFYDDQQHGALLLSMPLGQKQASMVLIMPHHLEPLQRLEKLLTRTQVDTWLGKMENRAVAISLPKISLEVSHNLQKHLAELGLTEVVDKSKADLSNISGKKDLYLSNAFHASALELAVEGNPFDTTIFGSDKLRDPKLFYVDHPFIFLVKDDKTKSILYIGRVVRPKGDKLRDEL